MKEQLISLETAKLAKEKGFDIRVLDCYNENGEVGDVEDYVIIDFNKFPTVKGSSMNMYSAPTQSLLQKWLRDEHAIYVYVFINVAGIYAEIFCPDNKEYNKTFGVDGGYSGYEKALEVGLTEALKLI